MIRLYSLRAATCIFLLTGFRASAATFGVFAYVDNGSTISITDCSSNATGSVAIPSLIDGKSVTEIGYKAFHGCGGVTSITIPNTVTTIGDFAFSNCFQLESIALPASITTAGTQVFNDCSSLKTVSWTSGLGTVPRATFANCMALESVWLPAGTTTIGASAFSGCKALTSISLPPGLTTISAGAFMSSGLTSIQIPDSVTMIGNLAFLSCENLTSVRLPDGLTELNANLFTNCALEVIELPPTVEVIGSECFSLCANLRKVVLPAALGKVDVGAFGYCTSLKQLRFPPNLRSIHNSIFIYSGMEKAFFEGPAPKLIEGDSLYKVAKNFQVFFVDGKKGFTWPTWAGVPATPLGPEIQVSQPHDKPITTRISKESFGARVTGYKRIKTFTIQNIGTRKLKGLSAHIIGSPDGDFTCTQPLRNSLEPGATTAIKVTFQPTDGGMRRAVFQINSNDSNEDPITIKISGLGMK